MKKMGFYLTLLALIVMTLTGCDMQLGSKHVDDSEQYGKWESYLNIPNFLPSSIDDYQVNSYSYTLLAYMDICYEIFLDISLTEVQFEQLITEAKSYDGNFTEKNAYYCGGYTEIVFKDYYRINDNGKSEVGWADIEKIVYNSETLNIVYVCFHAHDSNVYPFNKVAYFNKFSIKEDEYVSNLG